MPTLPARDGGAVLRALRSTVLPRNRRPVALDCDQGLERRGCTLGLTEDYASGRALATKATRRRPELTRELCAACLEVDPGFRFTSIQVNLNARYRMHTDGYDAGPSRMFCCGNFSHGRMWLHSWSEGDWAPVDAHDHWVAFDGREYHLTEEWEGPERYSLVYFTHPGFRSPGLSSDAREGLEELGFPWPREDDTFRAHLPKPRERRGAAAQSLPAHLATWEQALPVWED